MSGKKTRKPRRRREDEDDGSASAPPSPSAAFSSISNHSAFSTLSTYSHSTSASGFHAESAHSSASLKSETTAPRTNISRKPGQRRKESPISKDIMWEGQQSEDHVEEEEDLTEAEQTETGDDHDYLFDSPVSETPKLKKMIPSPVIPGDGNVEEGNSESFSPSQNSSSQPDVFAPDLSFADDVEVDQDNNVKQSHASEASLQGEGSFEAGSFFGIRYHAEETEEDTVTDGSATESEADTPFFSPTKDLKTPGTLARIALSGLFGGSFRESASSQANASNHSPPTPQTPQEKFALRKFLSAPFLNTDRDKEGSDLDDSMVYSHDSSRVSGAWSAAGTLFSLDTYDGSIETKATSTDHSNETKDTGGSTSSLKSTEGEAEEAIKLSPEYEMTPQQSGRARMNPILVEHESDKTPRTRPGRQKVVQDRDHEQLPSVLERDEESTGDIHWEPPDASNAVSPEPNSPSQADSSEGESDQDYNGSSRSRSSQEADEESDFNSSQGSQDMDSGGSRHAYSSRGRNSAPGYEYGSPRSNSSSSRSPTNSLGSSADESSYASSPRDEQIQAIRQRQEADRTGHFEGSIIDSLGKRSNQDTASASSNSGSSSRGSETSPELSRSRQHHGDMGLESFASPHLPPGQATSEQLFTPGSQHDQMGSSTSESETDDDILFSDESAHDSKTSWDAAKAASDASESPDDASDRRSSRGDAETSGSEGTRHDSIPADDMSHPKEGRSNASERDESYSSRSSADEDSSGTDIEQQVWTNPPRLPFDSNSTLGESSLFKSSSTVGESLHSESVGEKSSAGHDNLQADAIAEENDQLSSQSISFGHEIGSFRPEGATNDHSLKSDVLQMALIMRPQSEHSSNQHESLGIDSEMSTDHDSDSKSVSNNLDIFGQDPSGKSFHSDSNSTSQSSVSQEDGDQQWADPHIASDETSSAAETGFKKFGSRSRETIAVSSDSPSS